MSKDEEKNFTVHILPTAATLLGICFLVFSFVNVLKLNEQTLLDELAAVAIIVFLLACLASYASLRKTPRHRVYHKAADMFFIIGLVLLTLASIVITLKIIA